MMMTLALALLAVSPSHDALSVSNGFGAAVVDAETGALITLSTHAYAEASSGVLTPDLCFDSYPGLAVDEEPPVWLGKLPAESRGYDPQAPNVAQARHRHGGVEVLTQHLMPWSLERPAVLSLYRVTNTDTTPRTVRLAALANYHLGPGAPEASADAETIALTGAGAAIEAGVQTPHRMVYRAWPPPTGQAASPTNPYEAWLASGALPAVGPPTGPSPTLNDAVLGFAWEPVVLGPQQTAQFGLLAVYGTAAEEGELGALVDGWMAGRDLGAIAEDDRAAWAAWAAADTWAASLEAAGRPPSEDARAVWRQGLAVMRMSQVREANTEVSWPHGQILASLPPGMWNRAWPRDGAYAIAGLSRTGFVEEAWSALRFMLDAPGGAYTAEVGGDYLVSVCRYYGDGTEESDLNEHGPNIEFDGFGLFLWALSTWADHGGDLAALAPYWADIQGRVLEPLLGLISPENGLILPDSGIWEVHWEGQEKQFTHTSAAAAAGLCGAARLATALGDEASAEVYAAAAEGVRQAVLAELTDPVSGGIAGNLEEMAAGQALDAAAVEALNWGLVSPEDPAYGATLDAFEALRISPDRGYARNDDGGWYDAQEWVFINLRIASARALAGQQAEADQLIDWVITQTRANADLIAELYTVEDASYEGAIPMAGYGGGVFALATLGARPMMDATGCILPAPDPTPPDTTEGDATTATQDTTATEDLGPSAPETTGPVEEAVGEEAVREDVDTAEGTAPPPQSDGCAGGGAAAPWATLLVLLGVGRRRRWVTPGH